MVPKMISLENRRFWHLYKNVGNLAKIIVATSFEKLPKVQWNAQSGHTADGAERVE